MAKEFTFIGLVFSLFISICPLFGQSVRQQILDVAKSQIGVTETSENKGPQVDVYINHCGFKSPIPWCGCYVDYIYDSCGANTPIYPALASSWFPKNRLVTELDGVYVASTVGVYFPKRKGIHHVGIVEVIIDDRDVINISGNTSDRSVEEGDKVMRKRWPITQNIKFSDWIQTNPDYHTVKPQETIYRISVTYNVSIDALMKINNLKNYRIQVGQKIWLS